MQGCVLRRVFFRCELGGLHLHDYYGVRGQDSISYPATNMRSIFMAMLLAASLHAWSQGTFQNLDFENPILPLVRDANFEVPVSKAMPGWTAYRGANQIDEVAYNTVGLGGAVISFHDSTSIFPPIQGSYSVHLQPSSGGPPTSVAIAQTGLIPFGSRSLVFLTDPADRPRALFAGQLIPLVQIGTGPNYAMLGGDVSQFAGRSGE